LGATENATEPGPKPKDPALIVSQAAPDVAVHTQEEPVVNVIEPNPPPAASLTKVGASENEQPSLADEGATTFTAKAEERLAVSSAFITTNSLFWALFPEHKFSVTGIGRAADSKLWQRQSPSETEIGVTENLELGIASRLLITRSWDHRDRLLEARVTRPDKSS